MASTHDRGSHEVSRRGMLGFPSWSFVSVVVKPVKLGPAPPQEVEGCGLEIAIPW